jgi:hypothetical protein
MPKYNIVPIIAKQIEEMIKHGGEPWRIVCKQHIYDQLRAEISMISGKSYRTVEKVWFNGKSYKVELDPNCEKELLIEDLKIQVGAVH